MKFSIRLLGYPLLKGILQTKNLLAIGVRSTNYTRSDSEKSPENSVKELKGLRD